MPQDDPDGSRWTVAGTLVSPDIIANQINRDFLSIELARANEHYLGEGLKYGIHYNALKSKIFLDIH